MVMGRPLLQEILGIPWPFCQWRQRPSSRLLIAAKDIIFLSPFPRCFQGGEKGTLRNHYPRLLFGEWYLEMVMGGPPFQDILANPRKSCGVPNDPLFGP